MSLLLALQGAAAQSPLSSGSWPNPVTRKQSGQLTVATNLLLTALAVTAIPFAQYDWQNPFRGARGLQPSYAARAIAQDVQQRVPLFTQQQSRRPAQQDVFQNLLGTTLSGQQAASPFSPVEWSLPTVKRKAQADQFQNLLGTTLAQQESPFKQSEWGVPVRNRSVRSDAFPNLLETTLSVPFMPTEWAVPASKRFTHVWAAPNLLGNTLATAEQAPFSQTDWVVPAARRVTQADPLQNLLGTTLATGEQFPFVPVDWTLPAVQKRVAHGGVVPNLLGTTLFTEPAAPFLPIEWVLPHTNGNGHFPVALLSFVGSLPPDFIPPAPPAGFEYVIEPYKVASPGICRPHRGEGITFPDISEF